MLKKAAIVSSLLISTSLLLSGCMASPKSQFLDANKALLTADTYMFESVTNVDFQTFFSLPADDQNAVNNFKDTSFYLSGVVNKPVKEYEYTFAAKNKKELLFRFPILFTPKGMYFKTNELTKMPFFSQNQTTDLVEATYEDYPAYEKTATSLLSTYDVVSDTILTSISTLPESSFLPVKISDKEKKLGVDQKIQVSLPNEAYSAIAQNAYNAFLKTFISLPNLQVSKSELEQSQARFNNALDELNVDDVRLITAIDKKGNVMSHQLILESRASVDNRKFRTAWKTSVLYYSIGGEVGNSLKPETDKKVDIENVFLPF